MQTRNAMEAAKSFSSGSSDCSGSHPTASRSSGYTGQVLLLDRPRDYSKPTMKVVVDLNDMIATGEEIERWYCEVYGFKRGSIIIQSLPRQIVYSPEKLKA